MYESSKHANWLLVTLLLTLLISSLVLGWLLTRTSVFTSSQLLAATQTPIATTILEDSSEPLNIPTAPTASTPVATQAHAPLNTPPSQAATAPTKLATASLSILDSQQDLEQATIIPKPILPLATLSANTIYPNAPRTTAPTALTPQGLTYKTTTTETSRPILVKTGWIYAGQFQNGNWSLLGLNISQTELPQANNAYKLVWGANVRSAPPSQRMSSGTANLAENVGYLAEGSEIYILTVKPSGKNGHIWLEISY